MSYQEINQLISMFLKNPQEIVEFLVHYWEMVENTYMNTIKTVLRCLRDEQYAIIHYTADIR